MIPALVVVNPRARGGAGLARYRRARTALETDFDVEETFLDAEGQWRSRIAGARARGVGVVIAAGGDGTVNAVAGACVDAAAGGAPLVFGAVGLGSSNDFHKRAGTEPRDVPLRIDVARATLERPFRVVLGSTDGTAHEVLGWVSASIGFVAHANARFASAGRILAGVKRASVTGAIALVAARALASHHDLELTVQLRSAATPEAPCTARGPVANLSVLRTRHLAGPLAFDLEGLEGARLGAVLVPGRGRAGLLGAMSALARGALRERPGVVHALVDAVDVSAAAPVLVEVDGEVHRASSVRFEPMARGLWCAG